MPCTQKHNAFTKYRWQDLEEEEHESLDMRFSFENVTEGGAGCPRGANATRQHQDDAWAERTAVREALVKRDVDLWCQRRELAQAASRSTKEKAEALREGAPNITAVQSM